MKRTLLSPAASRLAFFALAWFALLSPLAADNWPRFRGPNGTGISQEKGFPVQWTEQDYVWKTKMPGLGHSCPCVWEDHVFLTSAEEEGRIRLVLDVSASTGKIRWIRRMQSESHRIHQLNSYASSTPATDGERVYVAFSKESEYALFAFDFAGKPAWKCPLGAFISQHGSGTSPVVFEDLVILGNDQDGSSSLVGVDAKSGKIRWKTERNLKQIAQATSYSTPVLIRRDHDQAELIFTSQADGFTSVDPRTGKVNWRADILPQRAVSSPVYGHGLVFASSGQGGEGKFLAAVRDGGSGELDSTYVAWTRQRQLPYVPTPVLYGDYIFLWGDSGVVSCVKAESGENVWTERLQGKYWASPICVDGKLYAVSEDGTVSVVAAAPQFKLLGRSSLGEDSRVTPAVSNGRMFFRGFEHLFCLPAHEPGKNAGS
jgi:outer membrane protein assembly factor BamB